MTAIDIPNASVASESPRRQIIPSWISSRLLSSLIAIWSTITITFIALAASTNPGAAMAGPAAQPGDIERINQQLGFDGPILNRYFTFVTSVLTGNLPGSIRTGENPFGLVLTRLPASLLLGGWALAISVVAGLAIGYLAATPGRWITRRAPATLATAVESVPPFFLGVVGVFVFAVWLGWLPTGGSGSPAHLVMPVLTLAIAFIPAIARVFRVEVARALRADHVRAAYSRGIPGWKIHIRHVGVNALIPTLNVVGTHGGVLLGGAILTESVFSWPGVGQLTIDAVANSDYCVVVASVTVIAVGYVLITFVIDVLSTLLDPVSRS
ncbi:MAG: ABC transporter permease [Gordonia sp. (in: high G+C Gram-positive bacteria)]